MSCAAGENTPSWDHLRASCCAACRPCCCAGNGMSQLFVTTLGSTRCWACWVGSGMSQLFVALPVSTSCCACCCCAYRLAASLASCSCSCWWVNGAPYSGLLAPLCSCSTTSWTRLPPPAFFSGVTGSKPASKKTLWVGKESPLPVANADGDAVGKACPIEAIFFYPNLKRLPLVQ